jgi:microcompartment protein CcmL/EutN
MHREVDSRERPETCFRKKLRKAMRNDFSSKSKKISLRALILVLCLGAVHPMPAQQTARLTQPVDDRARVTLGGTVHPLANARNDRGPASPDMQLERLQIILKRSPQQEVSLQQQLRDMHTPGTVNFHKWLTPDQFGQQFGAADQDVQTIENWLQAQGFQVLKVNPGKQTLEVSGSVGALQQAFHTSIHKYQVNGEQHYANAVDPEIPVALAPVFGGFVSLNNFRLRHYSHLLGSAQYDPKTHQAIPEWTLPGGTLGHSYAVAPEDFATQYNVTPLYNATKPLTGSGQTIAIINESNINIDFVNNFRTLFGLPASSPQVIIDGNDPGIDGNNNPDGPNGASTEAYLDVEWSGAVAPGATIDLVIGGDTSVEEGLMFAAERAVYSNIAPVISISFGQCEYTLGATNLFLNQLWEEAAAQGITVMVATGDSGSAGCDNPDAETVATQGLAVNGFASTPFNVAVGGTDFYYTNAAALTTYWNSTNDSKNGSLKGYIPEQAWNDSQYGLNLLMYTNGSIVGGGGGPSTCGNPTLNSTQTAVTTCAPIPKPSWQVATGVPSDGARDLPDVSLFASNGINGSYYAVCAADGDCQSATNPQISGVGGTSASAPAFAGIMAIVNQAYGPQGQADYVLYPLFGKTAPPFHDVTYGTNQMPCQAGTVNCTNGELTGYAAATGYDLATGLGSIDTNALVTDWNSRSNGTATTTTLTPSSSSFAHGTAVTLKTDVTGAGGTPTGDVAVVTDSPLVSNQGETYLTLASGVATGPINFLPGGSYNIWGSYSGDGKFAPSLSTKTPITVTPEASTLSLQVTENVQGQSTNVSGQQVPYGTPAILNGYPVPTTAYTCASNCPGFTSATGTVTFTDNGNALNTVVVNSEGDTEYTTGALAVGNHSIAASYSGDGSYNKSSSTPANIAFTVTKGTTQVGVTAAVATIAQGQTTTLSALVATPGGGAAPTGTVTFLAGSTSLGSGTLSAVGGSYASATYTITSAQSMALPVGAVALTGTYAGDSNYSSGTTPAPAAMLTVKGPSALLASTTTATASSATASPAARINVSITVTGKTGSAAPTGTVDLQSAGIDLTPGGILLPPGNPVATVPAVTTTYYFDNFNAALLQGSNTVVITYSGDTVYNPSQFSLPLTNPLADFSMVAQTPTVTVASGATGSATLNLGSINGFNAAVGLACTAPTGLTCSLTPASVTVNGNTTATLSIGASTPASSSIKAADLSTRRIGWFAASGGATLVCVFLIGIPARRRRWRALLSLVAVAVLTAGIGCGGGGGSTSTPTPTPTPTSTPTPAGTYTIVITGTQGTVISHAIPVTVIVTAAS